MPITPEQMRQIDQILAAAPADRATLEQLRKLGSGATATLCDAIDMADETPARSYERCNLYLLDGRDHCMKITGDPAAATGLIIAAKEKGQ